MKRLFVLIMVMLGLVTVGGSVEAGKTLTNTAAFTFLIEDNGNPDDLHAAYQTRLRTLLTFLHCTYSSGAAGVMWERGPNEYYEDDAPNDYVWISAGGGQTALSCDDDPMSSGLLSTSQNYGLDRTAQQACESTAYNFYYDPTDYYTIGDAPILSYYYIGLFPISSGCGDGTNNDTTEICDDGNTRNGDGCSSACIVELGYTCSASSPTVCRAVCGNGIKAGSETCDDNNTVPGDGCSSLCEVEAGYVCPGSPISTCRTYCGDGIKAGSETCDDGDAGGGDGCSGTCTVETGYTCNTANPNICSRCGDGVKGGTETCDDGNTTSGDGCSSSCRLETSPLCGNKKINPGEQCDGSVPRGVTCKSLNFTKGTLTCGGNCRFNTSGCR